MTNFEKFLNLVINFIFENKIFTYSMEYKNTKNYNELFENNCFASFTLKQFCSFLFILNYEQKELLKYYFNNNKNELINILAYLQNNEYDNILTESDIYSLDNFIKCDEVKYLINKEFNMELNYDSEKIHYSVLFDIQNKYYQHLNE